MSQEFNNFSIIANKYPDIYGKDKSKTRANIKYYLFNNQDSIKFKIYSIINKLYTKNMKFRKEISIDKVTAKSKYTDEYYNNLEKDNKIYLLEKEIEELKKENEKLNNKILLINNV
jgi:hypothetical protein